MDDDLSPDQIAWLNERAQQRRRVWVEHAANRLKKRAANAEMIEGYMDGYDLTAPEPSANRSHSYRHGFMVGRSEKETGESAASYDALEKMADEAMEKDERR